MTKIDIFSGFLGAGKTTLIKKLITEAFAGQQVVLIENEFGEIGIDGGFLKESGIQINELNAGCICCSLVGDFRAALQQDGSCGSAGIAGDLATLDRFARFAVISLSAGVLAAVSASREYGADHYQRQEKSQ